jgi:hypothetical protein
MDNISNNTAEEVQRTDSSATTGQRPTSESQRDESSPLSPDELQAKLAEAQAKVAELSRENSKHRNRAKEQEQAAQERLKAQGEFEQLAKQYESRVRELEPVASRYSQLAELLSSQIEAQIKDWPAEVKAFDPGKDAGVETRLAWVAKGEALVKKLQEQARAQSPGNGPNPRPATMNKAQEIDALRNEFQRKRGNLL